MEMGAQGLLEFRGTSHPTEMWKGAQGLQEFSHINLQIVLLLIWGHTASYDLGGTSPPIR